MGYSLPRKLNKKALVLTTLIILFLTLFTNTPTVSATAGQWSASGSVIYYNDGYIGIGTSSPTAPLHSSGVSYSTDTVVLNLSTISGRGWDFWTGKYGHPTKGDYSLTIAQPVYIGCETCKGDLQFKPGRNTIISGGKVGINTSNPQKELSVNGSILAKEVIVSSAASYWPDYVFADNYKLRTLAEVADYIAENRHLPDVSSTEEVAKAGISIGETQAVLLRKIEELTLYLIQQEKRIAELEMGVN